VVVSTHDDRVSQLADRVIEMVPQFSGVERPPESVALTSGEVLFRQDDVGELIYVLESGLLEVYRELIDGRHEVLARLGPGNYVGELGPILNLPRSATVRALEDSTLVAYTVRAFRQHNPHALLRGNG
jgi:putative ABC transport system ATP-binding protein